MKTIEINGKKVEISNEANKQLKLITKRELTFLLGGQKVIVKEEITGEITISTEYRTKNETYLVGMKMEKGNILEKIELTPEGTDLKLVFEKVAVPVLVNLSGFLESRYGINLEDVLSPEEIFVC